MQLHRIIFPVLFFEIIFTSLVAQPTHHFPIEHLSIENGLSNESINCILQDSHGFYVDQHIQRLKSLRRAEI